MTLTSTNDLAAARNREKLALLPGRLYAYEAIVEGNSSALAPGPTNTSKSRPGPK